MTWGDWFGFLWQQLTVPRFSWLVVAVVFGTATIAQWLWDAWRDNA